MAIRNTRWRRTHVMAATSVLLLAGVMGAAGLMLVQERRATWAAAVAAQAGVVATLERNVARNIEIYDLSLRAAARGMQLLDHVDDVAARTAMLFDGALEARFFRPLVIVDAAGDVLWFGGSVSRARGMNLAQRPFFRHHRGQHDPGLFVDFSSGSVFDGRPFLALSRRLEDGAGAFAGAVGGGIELGYFLEMFGSFPHPPGAGMALVTEDGRFVAGVPNQPEMIGSNISATEAGRLVVKGGSFVANSTLDGRARLFTSQRVGSMPLFVLLSQPADAILAEWRVRVAETMAGLLSFTAVSAVLFTVLRRELRLRRHAEIGARQAGEAARLSEVRLETYVDKLADGLVVVGVAASGRLMLERVNPAAEQIFGFEAGSATGRPLQAAWPGPYGLQLEGRLRECLAAGETLRFESLWDGDGAHQVLRICVSPAQLGPHVSEGPPVTLLLVSVRDVTREAGLEEHLRQAHRMEAVGQLTAGVAHDFNNLLQSQMGALELLLNAVAGQDEPTELASIALHAGERGARLTHSLLSFSRQQMLDPGPVVLFPILDRVRTILAPSLGSRTVLRLDCKDDLPPLFVDAAQLETTLLNLMLNAREAMPDGGCVLVEAYAGSSAASVPAGLPAAHFTVLAVSDEGIGMAPAVAARACEPFFTTKGVGQGSGLGLSVAKGFAEQSGGTLSIRSAPGRGTRVELWLPVARADAVAGQPEAVQGSGRLLLVDDEPMVLAVTAGVLNLAGFEVVSASDGATALALLADGEAFDAVVTDFAMPGIDGGELVRRLATLRPGLPAMVLTGHAEQRHLRTPPGVPVIHKPIRGDTLVRQLGILLSRTPQAARQAAA